MYSNMMNPLLELSYGFPYDDTTFTQLNIQTSEMLHLSLPSSQTSHLTSESNSVQGTILFNIRIFRYIYVLASAISQAAHTDRWRDTVGSLDRSIGICFLNGKLIVIYSTLYFHYNGIIYPQILFSRPSTPETAARRPN